jgi:hypothetical protein
MSVPTDFLRLYQELGIAPGASIEEIKLAYRRRVSELHPDRPGVQLSGADEAAARLQRITAYYNAALQFHRQHGRLPGTIVPPRTAAHFEGTAPMSGSAVPASPSRSRALVLAAILVAIAIAWFVSSNAPEEPALDTPVDVEATAPAKADTAIPDSDESDVPVRKSPSHGPFELDVGLTAEEVSRLEDAPVTHDDQRWDYGPSWIMFERGKVVDWYSSPLRPLRHATMHPRPHGR